MTGSDPTTCACGGASLVVETRRTPGGLRRRRSCRQCGARWTTYEVLTGMAVIRRPTRPRPEPRNPQFRVVSVRSATLVGGDR
jgi:transcriptional regulator NrdR family protein